MIKYAKEDFALPKIIQGTENAGYKSNRDPRSRRLRGTISSFIYIIIIIGIIII